jgi:hypothetical protein
MKALQLIINDWATRLGLGWIILLVVGLNGYWSLTLEAIGSHFQQIAGAPLLDLQNVNGILSAEAALALVADYSPEARNFYWIFFVLDNLMPPIVFGSFSLLWAYLLQRFPANWTTLATSPLLFVPWGVGLFDIWENLCFVLAMNAEPASALPTMQIGITLVYLKATCLFLTFGLTPVFVIVAAITQLRQRLALFKTA